MLLSHPPSHKKDHPGWMEVSLSHSPSVFDSLTLSLLLSLPLSLSVSSLFPSFYSPFTLSLYPTASILSHSLPSHTPSLSSSLSLHLSLSLSQSVSLILSLPPLPLFILPSFLPTLSSYLPSSPLLSPPLSLCLSQARARGCSAGRARLCNIYACGWLVVQRYKMEKVKVILADEGILYDIYTPHRYFVLPLRLSLPLSLSLSLQRAYDYRLKRGNVYKIAKRAKCVCVWCARVCVCVCVCFR